MLLFRAKNGQKYYNTITYVEFGNRVLSLGLIPVYYRTSEMHPKPFSTAKVTAALITWRGRILIARRPPNKKFGLLWEFPGGKLEPGESLEDCLRREIEEELCLSVRVGTLFEHVQFFCGDFPIELYAFWCRIQSGSLCLREHVDSYWAFPTELHRFELTDADKQLVPLLERAGAAFFR